MQKLVLASNNAGKVKKFQELLAPLNFNMIPQGELGIPSADEPDQTLIENALATARHTSTLSGLPVLELTIPVFVRMSQWGPRYSISPLCWRTK